MLDRAKDAVGAAQRGAGVPILSRANHDRRARALIPRGKNWGHRGLLEPTRAGMG
jgi:hypothetical protein